MGTQKGKLFELAEMYHSYQGKKIKDKQCRKDKKPVKVKGQHFDEGKSISLAYSLDMYPEVLYESYQRHEPVSQMSFWADDQSEAFYVEPFEAGKTVEIPHEEAIDEQEAKLDKIVKGKEEVMEEPEGMKEDEEKLDEMEKKLDKVVSSKEDTSAIAEASEEEDEGEEKEESKPKEETEKLLVKPIAEKTASPAAKKEQPYEVSDEEFARDIGAILKGQKVYDENQKKAVSRAGDQPQSLLPKKSAPAKPSAPKEDALDPSKNEHKIFEKIAQSMQYANSYDLGAIALDERFEKMEKEIEEEEVNKILHTKSTSQQKKDDIPDADVIDEQNPLKRKEPGKKPVQIGIEKYDPNVPLDTNNGGRLIKTDQLQKSDLVLVSSRMDSESIAGIYIGNDKILTKGDGDVLEEKPLQPGNKGVVVVLRHQNVTSEKASAIVDLLTKLRVGPEKLQPEKWVKINAPAISIHPDVCKNAEGGDKNKCDTYSGKIHLGTLTNDSFLCSESVIKTFENNQLSFTSLATGEHNGSLKYFGHLKNL